MGDLFTKFIKSNKLRYLLYALLISISVGACDDNSTNSIADPNSKLALEIDKVCDSVLTNHKILNGMIVGVWDDNTGFSYVKGKGYSGNANPYTPTPIMYFRAASITKTFVTSVALQLVDEGKIALDDSVIKYLPEMTELTGITIKQLCNMTSGLEDYATSKQFEKDLLAGANKKIEPKALIQYALDQPRVGAPGAVYCYSSANTVILGLIIEKVENKKLDEILNSRILSKYALSNTAFQTQAKMPTPFIHGYIYGIDFSEIADPSWAWAAGAITSNIYDLKKWAKILIDGEAGLISQYLQNQRFFGINQPSDPHSKYGLGIFTDGYGFWGHSGKLPGYTSVMMRNKEKNCTIIISFNVMDDAVSCNQLFQRIAKILYPNLAV
jgi:D-alanyl-D-alanine carboxypeptidase